MDKDLLEKLLLTEYEIHEALKKPLFDYIYYKPHKDVAKAQLSKIEQEGYSIVKVDEKLRDMCATCRDKNICGSCSDELITPDDIEHLESMEIKARAIVYSCNSYRPNLSLD